MDDASAGLKVGSRMGQADPGAIRKIDPTDNSD
jgi:hypothetical protein